MKRTDYTDAVKATIYRLVDEIKADYMVNIKAEDVDESNVLSYYGAMVIKLNDDAFVGTTGEVWAYLRGIRDVLRVIE